MTATSPSHRRSVPAYRKHRASGRAIVTLNGQDVYLGPYGSAVSLREYDRVIAEWLANGRRLPHDSDDRPDLLVNELILRYWEHALRHYVKHGRPTSELSNIRSALRPLRKLYGHTAADRFGPLALKAVREQYIAAGHARTTVNRYVGHIKRMFKWAVGNELVRADILHGLQAVAGLRKGRTEAHDPDAVKPVPDQFVDAIEPYVSAEVWAMVRLQRLTGMRPGEVTEIRTRDINTDGEVWVYRPAEHKTEHHDQEREVPLGPQAQQVLRPWLSTDLEASLFSPAAAEEKRNAVRRARRLSPMTPSQANRKRKAPKRP